ncbi:MULTISPECIES: DUF6636 domain-containing protein [Candidatus Neomicrothrix]|jgi:hypothetical protein|uniref:Ig-like domain-containing protein n=1 Tax=Candidatus Neomicrothrix parvicella RN1 TaxID=1229780 RepID=R4Z3K2_9ACTN|nr:MULTISPECIES: DUF6636 domain-containing protein [Microthrix]NLH66695.1 hypothetical protein [Candidatus Microthrix parvicella]MBK6502312.1 hypothetical protein [Candidatus Microthrix sp.]MBK7020464.1 hypothetical protein [Candidatus Microthrix sp.]MBK7322422.1 hypothetical protein [Candidatus Microthrix sp.]MBL0203837.1 hypothetical protein [Candidatus Microthrix sp.]
MTTPRSHVLNVVMAAAVLLLLTAGSACSTSPPPQGPVAFQSPSGRITCQMYDGADCMVNPNSWKLPPRPKWCDYDWGASVEVTTKAHLTCRGDANNPGSVLAYGRSTQRGNFVCLSERSGMTCVNKKNGHGFKVNRASYQLF